MLACGIYTASGCIDPVWDPYHKTELEAIESIHVQKFALRMYLKSWSTDYDHLLLESKLLSLKTRRSVLNLNQLYIQDHEETHTLS